MRQMITRKAEDKCGLGWQDETPTPSGVGRVFPVTVDCTMIYSLVAIPYMMPNFTQEDKPEI